MFDPSLYDKADLSDEEAEELEELEVLQVLLGFKMEAGTVTSEQLADFAERVRRFKQAVRRRKTIPREMRAAIWEMTNGRCFYCGRWTNPYETLEIDHIRPKSRGGTDDIDNLVPSCKSCNQSKRGQLLDEWRVGRAAQHYELGYGHVARPEEGPLWFETEDFRAAGYDQRRKSIIEQWKQDRREFNFQFLCFPRYAPTVCRPHGLLYDFVWNDGKWMWDWEKVKRRERRKKKADPLSLTGA